MLTKWLTDNRVSLAALMGVLLRETSTEMRLQTLLEFWHVEVSRASAPLVLLLAAGSVA